MEAQQNFRSPPYPTMGLERALEKAKQLREIAKGFTVPLSSAAKAWGFSEKSSSTTTVAAALNQFGLITDEGSRVDRKIGLSALGESIILDVRPNSREREIAVREAALFPKIFKELWERFRTGDVDTHTLVYELTLGRKNSGKAPYSEAAADEVAKTFRETVSFANLEVLEHDGPLAERSSDMQQQDESLTEAARRQNPSGQAMDHLPRHGSRKDDYFEERKALDEGEATLIWPRNLSEDSVEDMEYWLTGVLRQIRRRSQKTASGPAHNDS
jgi:hypothetical protein